MPVTISESSIMQKLNEYAKTADGRKRISERISSYEKMPNKPNGHMTDGGSLVVTNDMRDSITSIFIAMIVDRAHSASLPQSVDSIFDTLDVSDIRQRRLHDGTSMTEILISFNGKLLPRMSLYFYGENRRLHYTGNGINNIVSLFDTGYSLNAHTETPYGYWTGHEASGMIYARRSRARLGFMKQAIDDFNMHYGHIARADFGDDVDGYYAR